MLRKQDGAGPDASAKVQISTTGMAASVVESQHVGQGCLILGEVMPPHQLEQMSLALVVEAIDRGRIVALHDPLPFASQLRSDCATTCLDLVQVLPIQVSRELAQEALLQIGLVLVNQ